MLGRGRSEEWIVRGDCVLCRLRFCWCRLRLVGVGSALLRLAPLVRLRLLVAAPLCWGRLRLLRSAPLRLRLLVSAPLLLGSAPLVGVGSATVGSRLFAVEVQSHRHKHHSRPSWPRSHAINSSAMLWNSS